MAESTARVERTAHVSEALYFAWDVPEKPLAIRVSLDLVDRLDREVVASFRSVNERGSEIGGILLGRFIPGTPDVVAVTEYGRIACDYSRGPLYRLLDADKERFDAALRQHAGQELAVVGMFRSNTRRGLSLDPEDIAFLGDRFPDPRQVMLLIRPFATKPSVAGFFIRENGAIHGESSYLEFPFARAELLKSSAPLDAAAAGSAPASATPAKTTGRAQVVPIAPRRDAPAASPRQAAPEPKPAAQTVVAPAAAPEPKAAAAEPKEAAPEPPAPAPPVEAVAPPAPVTAPVPEAVSLPEQPARPALFDPLPSPSFGLADEESPAPQNKKWLWVACASVAALVLAVGLFFYPGFLIRRSSPPAAVAQSPANLELRVERNVGQLVLTWNRESEVIKTATKAVLTISDGPQRENVDLDLAQLRNGSVIYAPVTSDVNFRLDVTSSKPELSRSELVRVLGTRPSPMPPAGTTNASNSAAQQPLSGDAQADGQASENADPAPPRKNLNTQPLAQRLRPAPEADLPEPPSISGGPAVHQAAALPVVGAALPAPPPAAAPVPPPPPAAAAQQASPARISVGGKVQDAKLIKRVEPLYPAIARQARVTGTVEIEATIGKDGAVRQVRALTGHPLLQQAAADAVKKWLYTPTLLNGTPVEVVTRVNIGFTLGR